MRKTVTELLAQFHIHAVGAVPLSACRIRNAGQLQRAGISSGTAFIMAVPYYSPACDGERNISAYAVPEDYHLFFRQVGQAVLPVLRERFPENRFELYADASPIYEVEAAAMAGLGVVGRNGLLLTELYSSYVFLGSLLTDASVPCEPVPVRHCEDCGACLRACPANLPAPREFLCRSALTQKKGILEKEEEEILGSFPSVWGCDICQEVCPYTKKAKYQGTIYTNIPFFTQNCLPVLTKETILSMSQEAFSRRAYAWRGRDTILRNLELKEDKKHD